MPLSQYIVNAFTRETFAGNPAAIVPLQSWLSDDLMQSIAMQNNLSETAFYVPVDNMQGQYNLRWFTPTMEVDFCGHATLAAGHVVLHHEQTDLNVVTFVTRSGELTVKKGHDGYALNFPTLTFKQNGAFEQISDALGSEVIELYSGDDYLAVLKNQNRVVQCQPDIHKLKQLDLRGVIITAQGNDVDFVSRFFAPKAGIDEDPVTGSAHCMLAPYWAKKFSKHRLSARQLSARGGEMTCELKQDRVHITAQAKTFATAKLIL